MIGFAYAQFDSFDLQDAASEDDLSVAETAGAGGGKGGAAGGKVTSLSSSLLTRKTQRKSVSM